METHPQHIVLYSYGKLYRYGNNNYLIQFLSLHDVCIAIYVVAVINLCKVSSGYNL